MPSLIMQFKYEEETKQLEYSGDEFVQSFYGKNDAMMSLLL